MALGENEGASARPGNQTFEEELAAFARDLQTLRLEHGKPSLRDISRRAPASQSLSVAGVSEVLNGKRLPRLDFLMALVRVLLAHDEEGRPVPGKLDRNDPRLDTWRKRWRDLEQLRTRPPSATQAVPGPAAHPAGSPAGDEHHGATPALRAQALEGGAAGDTQPAALEDVPAHADGGVLVTVEEHEGGDGHVLKLWDVATRQPIGAPLTGPGRVSSVAVSWDGRFLATGGEGVVSLRETATPSRVRTMRIGPDRHSSVFNLAFSPDGHQMAVRASGLGLSLLDVATGTLAGEPLITNQRAWKVFAVGFSPDASLLAAGRSSDVSLWDPSTGQLLGKPLTDHTDHVRALAFSPDGRVLATGGEDAAVLLWDPATGQRVGALVGHTAGVPGVAFSPDGRVLATASFDGTVRLWDPATCRPLGPAPADYHERFLDLAFSPDGQVLATLSHNGNVRLWDPATGRPTGEPLVSLKAMSDSSSTYPRIVLAPAFQGWEVSRADDSGWSRGPRPSTADRPTGDHGLSRAEELLVSAHRRGTAVLLHTLTGHTKETYAVAFSSDGRLVASGGADETVRLWDAATGQSVGRPLAASGAVGDVVFSPDGTYLAAAEVQGTSAWLWRLPTGQLIPVEMGKPSPLWALAFSAQSHLLALGRRGEARVWNLLTREPFGPPLQGLTRSVDGAVFSPDARFLAMTEQGQVLLWDTDTGLRLDAPLTADNGVLSDDVFALDGLRFTGTRRPGEPGVWAALRTGLDVPFLPRDDDAVYGVAFSPDGHLVAAGNRDGTVRVWVRGQRTTGGAGGR